MVNDNAISGLAAGAVGTLVGYPLDTIKAHLQAAASKGGQASITGSFSSIYQRGGFSGFYSGVTAPLVSLAATSSVNFGAYTTFRHMLGGPSASVAEGRRVDWYTIAAGAMVGPVLATINTPLELIKLQLQVHGPSTVGGYRNASHAITSIVSANGPRSLYLGFGINIAREVVFGASYFGFYELGVNLLHEQAKLPMAVAVPIAGGMAGLIAWMNALPLDTIKTMIQVQNMHAARTLTPAAAAASVMRASGPMGFYRGALPSIIRAFIVNAVRISVYEIVLSNITRARGQCCECRDRQKGCMMCSVFTCRV